MVFGTGDTSDGIQLEEFRDQINVLITDLCFLSSFWKAVKYKKNLLIEKLCFGFKINVAPKKKLMTKKVKSY